MNYTSQDWIDEKRFKKLPELLTPKEVADLLRLNHKSVYFWRYNPETYNTPSDLFHKFVGKVYIRKNVLRQWWNER